VENVLKLTALMKVSSLSEAFKSTSMEYGLQGERRFSLMLSLVLS